MSTLPKSWRSIAGLVGPLVAPPTQGPSAARPRAADPPAPPPKKDPNKDAPAAADPVKCAKCEAEVPTMEPPAKFCPSCGEAVGEAAPAAPKDGEPAKALALGRHALALTGTTSPEAARGVLAAWKESYSTAGPLAAELATATSQLEHLERERVLERAVAEERLDPSEAWSFDVDKDGKKVRAFSAWAGPPQANGTGQSLEQLNAFLARRSRTSGTGPARSSKALTPAAPSAPTASPPPRGIDPEIYAAAKRQVADLTGGES